jgi:flavin-dependent dehydrogenase
MACANGGYVGLVRLEDGRLNIAAAFDTDLVKRCGGLGHAAASVLREAGLPAIDGIDALPWHGTPRLTRHVDTPAARRLFLLGDAASFVEPFTGEGMAWALASGVAVVPFVVQACQAWRPALSAEWTDCYRHTIVRRQLLCRAAALALRHPSLVRMIVAAVHHFPLVAAPFVRSIGHAGIWKVARRSAS